MYLGEIARIIDHFDCFADEGCQCRLDIPPPSKADAIAQNFSRLGDMYEQHIKLIETFGHCWQKASLLPSGYGSLVSPAVNTQVIDAAHERLEMPSQCIQRERWLRQWLGRDQIARQIREKHVVNGTEQSLYLAATARTARQGMDEPNF